jgi:hypothetical protein
MVSIEQAAQNALARWIAQELRDVPVRDRWPEANVRLPAKTVTVLRAGSRRDEVLDSVAIKSAPVAGASGRALFTWRMRACTQPLQLDVWAHSDVARDDLLARLEPVLNASKARSMPALKLSGADPVEHGLALLLADGWEGFASYWFDEPSLTDTPDAVQRSEYRATYRGSAAMQLTLDVESPRLARVALRQRLDGCDELTPKARN